MGQVLFVLALVSALAWVVRDSLLPTIDRSRLLEDQIRQAKDLKQALEEECEALNRDIRGLSHEPDAYYVEYLLRSRYGFGRPGEHILNPK